MHKTGDELEDIMKDVLLRSREHDLHHRRIQHTEDRNGARERRMESGGERKGALYALPTDSCSHTPIPITICISRSHHPYMNLVSASESASYTTWMYIANSGCTEAAEAFKMIG